MSGEIRVLFWGIVVFLAVVYGPPHVQREFAKSVVYSGLLVVDGKTYSVTPRPGP